MPWKVSPSGVAARARTAAKVDFHSFPGSGCPGVRYGIRTRTPIEVVTAKAAHQGVIARAARQGVVAPTAIQPVGKVVAGERVIVARTLEMLNATEGIALGVAARGRAPVQVHAHPGLRPRVGCGVHAFTPVEGVVACAAFEGVVARAALQGVVALFAVQAVVALFAVQAVVALFAVQAVVACAAPQAVVALFAVQAVVACAAFEGVVARAAPQVCRSPRRRSGCRCLRRL